MVDFRQILSPKSQAEITCIDAELLAFQQLDPAAMAKRLLEYSRRLQDSGCFSDDQRYSYDEWAIYRIVPALAKRLDPHVELRETEQAKDHEREDALTWVEDAPDEQLLYCISSIISNGSFARARTPDTDPEIKITADSLFGIGISMLSIAADTAIPGSYPERQQADVREPLEGLYVIEVCGTGYHRVAKYSEDISLIDRTYDVAVAIHKGEEVPEQDIEIRDSLKRRCTMLPVDAVQIQTYSGEVLREYSLVTEPAPAPEL
jgi:hypothetical protein